MIDQNMIQRAVRRIVDATHPKRIILFGSYGRDQATEDSDLDLMIIQPRVEDQAAAMVDLRQLLGSMGMGVDVLVYSEAEYERRSRVPGTVHYWARLEGKTLYEAAS